MRKLIFTLLALAATLAQAATVKNPMIWADAPDMDVLRVGNDYYMVSTTMHLMPGAPIMHSTDLKHWQTVGYIFDKLTDSPKYEMQEGTAYGRGQWATSLQYHDGMFYALFAPNDPVGGKTYIYRTKDPRQKWELVSRVQHFHDASLLFDDDGRVYVFSVQGQVDELTPDLQGLRPDGFHGHAFDRDSTETGLLEGSRVIKVGGKYYAILISSPIGGKRRQVCYRADNIRGPWEKKVILESRFADFWYVGQGTIVDSPSGQWYGVIFQDRGGVGRVPLLMPCTWKDGWPMLGDADGHVPTIVETPFEESSDKSYIIASDDFDGEKLGIDWQWNHNPIDSHWALGKRKGCLRLDAIEAPNIFLARNTLTQRMGGPTCTGDIHIYIGDMADGDRAGLAAFNGDTGMLIAKRDGKKTTLAMATTSCQLDGTTKAVLSADYKEIASVEVKGKELWLRLEGDFHAAKTDIARFYYKTSAKGQWQPLGEPYTMRFDYRRMFMGSKFAIFNYATKAPGGFIDVDYFHYSQGEK